MGNAEACDFARLAALAALEHLPDHGWRQTRPFVCCGERQIPTQWNDLGRSLCTQCGTPSPYDGHASFQIPKWLSSRHRLRDLVNEFVVAQGNPELLKKVTNTGFAELWKPIGRESFDGAHLVQRREAYGPDDLPDGVLVITAFTDVQGDRLETQFIGWGADEESWAIQYEITHLDPAQPEAWSALRKLLLQKFRTRDGRILRVSASGIDTGGHHGDQVYAFARRHRGLRVYPCKGVAGRRPIWPLLHTRSKKNEKLWLVGVDAAKEAIYGRLKIEPPVDGDRKPGFIHFPDDDDFGPAYFAQLTAERRELKRKMGQSVAVWTLPSGRRNEALDTFVGSLAVRRSLPRRIERTLEYAASDDTEAAASVKPAAPPRVRPLAVASDPYL